jgi:hypothetical protein
MKKLLLALFLAALPALGQVVDSSQVKKATNGGLTGDAANGLWVAPYRGTSAPSSPVTGALWCDTNFSPCILKQYTGSVWTAPAQTPALPTQADPSSLPGSPVDGQVFFSKSPYALYVYDSTAATWYYTNLPFVATAGQIRDVYTAAVITAPATTATAATNATAGSLGAGCYSYKITFVNAAGGETTPSSQTNSVTPGLNKSADLSSIPTGGTGTTKRRIYRSKSGGCTNGPWYYTATVNDNSTTTLTAEGLADNSQLNLVPSVNFSGALPGSWTWNGATNNVIGGGGTTSRNTMACHQSARYRASSNSSLTSDVNLGRCQLDISSYVNGDLTIQYRIVGLYTDGTTQSVLSPCAFGLRVGTNDNAVRTIGCLGGGDTSGTNWTGPFSSSNHLIAWGSQRASTGATANNFNLNNSFPQVDSLPMWVRLVKRSSTWNSYWSADGVNWSIHITCTNTSNSTAACGWGNNTGSATNTFEIPMSLASSADGTQGWIEIDSFTLTVN